MTINTSWQIKIGSVASPTDFTSRVMSMNIVQSVDVNVIGRGIANVTLLNKDGALTPGGGGTYGTTDWFAQAVFISSLTNTGGSNTETQVFHGIVTNFDLHDDGVFSTVTITALDGLSVGGKTGLASPNSIIPTMVYNQLLDINVYDNFFGASIYPLLGRTYSYGQVDIVGQSAYDSLHVAGASSDAETYADLWQTNIVPTANDVLYATIIEAATDGATPIVNYRMNSIPYVSTRTVAESHTFEFDQPSALSGSKLPFDDEEFQQAFNNETLINRATIASENNGVEYIATASNSGTYAQRNVAYTKTCIKSSGGGYDTTTLKYVADRLVNRYSTPRFTPVQLRTSSKLVARLADNAAVSKWRSLLGIQHALWQKVKVTWTGSGASSQTAYCVVKGREINVTPDEAFITLMLANWNDNHGFILDEDVLDTGRLG
jgi:hypothetical protein